MLFSIIQPTFCFFLIFHPKEGELFRTTQENIFLEKATANNIMDSPSSKAQKVGSPMWEDMWQAGISKGQAFDCGIPSPALLNILKREDFQASGGDAFVPGCGRGYDAIALAEAGFTVTGLDLSSTAVESANQYLDEIGGVQNSQGSVTFQVGDFFDVGQQFDMIFDYTFLCALPPDLHEAWAQKMKSLLKPGGELITLIFPICDKDGGPPYKMSIEYVKDLCEGAGFESSQLEILPSHLCNEGRDGSEGSLFGAKSGIGRWHHTSCTSPSS
mmetsp:Transcript_4701/g.6457  ORF Transcript_4701/g.6457 Transcript_4701/m.6457 type:complete len:272 (+) Transcript_4701:40-855(+)